MKTMYFLTLSAVLFASTASFAGKDAFGTSSCKNQTKNTGLWASSNPEKKIAFKKLQSKSSTAVNLKSQTK